MAERGVEDKQARLAAARVHLQMRVPLQFADLDQRPPLAYRQPLFRAAVGSRTPSRQNHRLHLLARNAPAKCLTEIGTVTSVEAEVPNAVRGESAAVACAAKRARRGRDDTEGRSVG